MKDNMAKIVCAAFVRDGKILLVKRAPHRKWSANRWDLVGGHVDKGEKRSIALVRECEEEVGLTPVDFNRVRILYESSDPDNKTPFHVYEVVAWTGGEAQLLGDEHSELGWFTCAQVQDMDIALDAYLPVIVGLLQRP
jgi:8-oxo-dGTP diphosphatase